MNFFVTDNLIPRQLVNAAIADWPADDWSGWHVYDNGKRASRSINDAPDSIKEILRIIGTECRTFRADAFPDLTCYAAGLHDIPAGHALEWHRDATKHPLKPWQRVQTSILYLDKGGNLRFRGYGVKEEIEPFAGRLASFESDESCEHSVARSDQRRRSLAVFFYRYDPTYSGRTNADFARPKPACRHCGEPTEYKLTEVMARFYSCEKCGCESSDLRYEDVEPIYARDSYRQHYKQNAEESLQSVLHNCNLIRQLAGENKTVLDVGCLNGAILASLFKDGWDVFGFDVNREIPAFVENLFQIPADRIAVGKEFRADGRQFGCVVSREVIEHATDHKQHFAELVKSIAPGGILHLQTPRPCNNPDDRLVYQTQHLQVLSPETLQGMFEANGLKIEHSQIWENGQVWTGRKTQ